MRRLDHHRHDDSSAPAVRMCVWVLFKKHITRSVFPPCGRKRRAGSMRTKENIICCLLSSIVREKHIHMSHKHDGVLHSAETLLTAGKVSAGNHFLNDIIRHFSVLLISFNLFELRFNHHKTVTKSLVIVDSQHFQVF